MHLYVYICMCARLCVYVRRQYTSGFCCSFLVYTLYSIFVCVRVYTKTIYVCIKKKHAKKHLYVCACMCLYIYVCVYLYSICVYVQSTNVYVHVYASRCICIRTKV